MSVRGTPLPPLRLDFLFGRAFLTLRDGTLRDGVSVKLARIELPDVRFPLTVSDPQQLAARRGTLRALRLRVDARVLVDAATAANARPNSAAWPFWDIRITLQEGAVHVGARVRQDHHVGWLGAYLAPLPPQPHAPLTFGRCETMTLGVLPLPATLLFPVLLRGIVEAADWRGPLGDRLHVTDRGEVVFPPMRRWLAPWFVGPQAPFAPDAPRLPGDVDLEVQTLQIEVGGIEVTAAAGQDLRRIGQAALEEAPAPASPPTQAWMAAAMQDQALTAGLDGYWRPVADLQIAPAAAALEHTISQQGPVPTLVALWLDSLLASGDPTSWAQVRAAVHERLSEDPDDLVGLEFLLRLRAHDPRTRVSVEDAQRLLRTLHAKGRGPALAALLTTLAYDARHGHDDPDADAVWSTSLVADALRLDPRSIAAWQLRAAHARRVGDTVRLQEALQRLVGLLPEGAARARVHLEFAEALLEDRGDPVDVRFHLDRARAVLARDARVTAALARCCAQSGRVPEALRWWTETGDLLRREDPAGAAAAHLQAAQMWTQSLQDSTNAAIAVRRALAADPAHPEATRAAASTAVVAKRLDDAARVCREAVAAALATLESGTTPEALSRLAHAIALQQLVDTRRGRAAQSADQRAQILQRYPHLTLPTITLRGADSPTDSPAPVDTAPPAAAAPIPPAHPHAPADAPAPFASTAAVVDAPAPAASSAPRDALPNAVQDAFATLKEMAIQAAQDDRLDEAMRLTNQALQLRADETLATLRRTLTERTRPDPRLAQGQAFAGTRSRLQRAAARIALPVVAPAPEPAPTPPAPTLLPADALDALRQAARQQQTQAAWEALAHGLGRAEADVQQDATARAQLLAELGGVRFYELDDAAGAAPVLMRAYQLDPAQILARPEVFSALETVADEQHRLDVLVDLYRGRIAQQHASADRATWEILLADLYLRRLQDPLAARQLLDGSASAGSDLRFLQRRAVLARQAGEVTAATAICQQWAEHPDAELEDRAHALRESAEAAYTSGSLDAALSALRAALTHDPMDARAAARLTALAWETDRAPAVLEGLRLQLGVLLALAAPPSTWDAALVAVERLTGALATQAADLLLEGADALRLPPQPDPAAALRTLEVAHQLAPDDPSVLEAWVDAARALDDRPALHRGLLLLADRMLPGAARDRILAAAAATVTPPDAGTAQAPAVAVPPAVAPQDTRSASGGDAPSHGPSDQPAAEVPAPAGASARRAVDPLLARLQSLDAQADDDPAAALDALDAILRTTRQPTARRALLVRKGAWLLRTDAPPKTAMLALKGALILQSDAADVRVWLAAAALAAGDRAGATDHLQAAQTALARRPWPADAAATDADLQRVAALLQG